MKLLVEKNFYKPEAINAAMYIFSGDFYVSCNSSSEFEDKYIISIEKKSSVEPDRETEVLFTKELIDQQLRLDLEARFGHIRDLIVEEAFKPVSKE